LNPSAIRLALAGMASLAVAMGIGRFAFTPVFPMMQADAALSLAEGGWLAAGNYLGYFAGAVSAIWIRTPAPTMIRVTLVAVALLTAAMGFVHEFAAWMALRALAGIASAWTLVFTSTWVLEQLARLDARRLAGVLFGGVGFGMTLAGVGCLLFARWSWKSADAWIALGVLAAVLSAASWGAYRDGPRNSGSAPRAAHSELRGYLVPIACYGIYGFGYIIPATFLPAMARDVIADPAVFGWAWPVFGLAALLSTLAAGRLTVRVSLRAIWAGSHAVMAVGVAVPVLLPGMPGIVVSALCVGGTFVVITLAATQEARRLAPAAATGLVAAMTAAFALGQILGPVLVSLAARSHAGMDGLLGFSAALLAASAVVLFRWHPSARP
jgi:predicted MFS family arabinose efflux permease